MGLDKDLGDMLPYCQIQGITGARIEGVWFDRAAISDEVWAHVSRPKSYRETVQPPSEADKVL